MRPTAGCAAFLTGWTSFVAGFSGAIAASAVVLAFYLGRFVPIAGDSRPLLTVPLPFVPLTISPQTVIAVAAIWLMSFVHIRGVGPGRLVGNVLASLKVAALLLFIALGFAFGTGLGGQPHRVRRRPGAGPVAVRAHSRALHVRRLERRVLRGRGDPRPRPQRAAAARASARSPS